MTQHNEKEQKNQMKRKEGNEWAVSEGSTLLSFHLYSFGLFFISFLRFVVGLFPFVLLVHFITSDWKERVNEMKQENKEEKMTNEKSQILSSSSFPFAHFMLPLHFVPFHYKWAKWKEKRNLVLFPSFSFPFISIKNKWSACFNWMKGKGRKEKLSGKEVCVVCSSCSLLFGSCFHYNRIKEEQGNKRTHRINHKIVNKWMKWSEKNKGKKKKGQWNEHEARLSLLHFALFASFIPLCAVGFFLSLGLIRASFLYPYN